VVQLLCLPLLQAFHLGKNTDQLSLERSCIEFLKLNLLPGRDNIVLLLSHSQINWPNNLIGSGEHSCCKETARNTNFILSDGPRSLCLNIMGIEASGTLPFTTNYAHEVVMEIQLRRQLFMEGG